MLRFVHQWIEQVWGAGDGDLRHSRLGLVTGMGQTPDCLPPVPQGCRLAVRSPANSAVVDVDNVVGIALPHRATVTSCTGTDLYASSLGQAADYWTGHLVVMVDGDQQGRFRRVTAFASGHLTLAQAFPSDPAVDDELYMIPLRVSDQPWVMHGDGVDDTFHYYATAMLSGGGLVSLPSVPVRVEFDSAGDLRGPVPNAVRNARVTPIAGGKFVIRFEYVRLGQGQQPTDFQVFGDAESGTIDYETPLTDSVTGLDYVAYVPGRIDYKFTTEGFDDGATLLFDVIARNDAETRHAGTGPVPPAAMAVAVGPEGLPSAEAWAIEAPPR